MRRSGWWRPLVLLLVTALVLAAGCTADEEGETDDARAESDEDAGAETGQGSGEEAGEPAPSLQTLQFIIDTEQFRLLEAEAIAQQLRTYGIEVQVRPWEWTALQPKIQAGERTAYMTDWGSAFFDAFDLAVPKLRTDDRGNYSFYSNPQFDELVDIAITETSADTRRKAYYTAQEVLRADAPWVFGYYLQAAEGARAEVGDWSPAMDSRINLHDVTLEGGGPLVVGLNTDAVFTLDPVSSYRDRETETVIRNLFDGLVTRTRDGEVVPELATSWDISADGRSYTFSLRRGVSFHDGSPFTADDVVFSFRKILGRGRFAESEQTREGTSRAGLIRPQGVEVSVEKIDDYAVLFRFSKSFPVFLQGLVHQQVVPSDVYGALIEGAEGDGFGARVQAAERAFAAEPVGTGPFRFAGGQLNEEIRLTRYPDYYGGAPDLAPVGPAPIETAVFRMMPDPATRVGALQAGEVHIVQSVPADLMPQIEGSEEAEVQYVEGTRAYMLELNNARPPFDDVRVRRALNHAVDWQPILENLYRGLATRLPTAFLPSGFGYNPAVEPYPHDPGRAVELLTEAGYEVSLPE